MTVIEQHRAMNALGEVHIFILPANCMEHFGASLRGVEIGGCGVLRGPVAHGYSYAEAVSNLWYMITDNLSDELYLVKNASGPIPQRFRWNGSMWEQVLTGGAS